MSDAFLINRSYETELTKALNKAGVHLFTDKSSYPLNNAQQNLKGRTHYVDDDTLRYFKSKILESNIIAGGAFFYVIESTSLDMNHSKRGFRYVLFDVFGSVIDRVNLDESWRTKDQAKKAFWKFYGIFDGKQYYKDRLSDKIKTVKYEIESLESGLSFLNEDGTMA
jgi:hypothetical protein